MIKLHLCILSKATKKKKKKKKKRRYTCLIHIEKCYVYNIFLTNPKYQVVISSYYWGKKIILVDIYIYIYTHRD